MPSNRRLLSVVRMAIAIAMMFRSTLIQSAEEAEGTAEVANTLFAGLNITLGR